MDAPPERLLVELGTLFTPPSDWAAQIKSLANQKARTVRLDGKSLDCRESVSSTGMTYKVVTGDDVAKDLPWLLTFYATTLASFISNAMRRPLVGAINPRYGININVLDEIGGRYEWHVDPCPVSAVLFITEHEIGDGGELALREGETTTSIYPRQGLMVIFEGRRIEHAVLPLLRSTSRISIPMLFYHSDEEQYFPRELDEYLYGSEDPP